MKMNHIIYDGFVSGMRQFNHDGKVYINFDLCNEDQTLKVVVRDGHILDYFCQEVESNDDLRVFGSISIIENEPVITLSDFIKIY